MSIYKAEVKKSFFSTQYVNFCRVRLTVYFLITLLFFIALAIGSLVQFLNFIFAFGNVSQKLLVLFPLLMPVLFLVFATLIDDLITLILDAMDRPPCIALRAEILTAFSIYRNFKTRGLKYLNNIVILTSEGIPLTCGVMFCISYNAWQIDLFISGYLLGGCVFALFFGLVFTLSVLLNSLSESRKDEAFDFAIVLERLETVKGFCTSSYIALDPLSNNVLDSRIIKPHKKKALLFFFIYVGIILGVSMSMFLLPISSFYITGAICLSVIAMRFSYKAMLPNATKFGFDLFTGLFVIITLSLSFAASKDLKQQNDTVSKPLILLEKGPPNFDLPKRENSVYPVCNMRWGNASISSNSRYLTLFDLLPLTEIIYNFSIDYYDDTLELKRAFANVYEGTDVAPVTIEHLDKMDQFSRSAVLYFNDLKIRVMVIRGTIMGEEAFYNLNLYSFTQVLNIFDKFSPILGLLPDEFVSKIVAWVDLSRFVNSGDPLSKQFNQAKFFKLKSLRNGDQFIIVGHSLGGLMAGTIGSRIGVPALAVNPPGSKSLRERLQIKRNVNVYQSLTTIKLDKDPVSNVDSHLGSINMLNCNFDPLSCHSSKAALCELYAICRDEHNRTLNLDCSKKNFTPNRQ